MRTSKLGTVSVFLTMVLFVSLLTIGVMTEAATGKAARTYGNSILDLAGRSILSEFNKTLYDKYGVFGIHTDEETVEKKLGGYIEENLGNRSGSLNLIQLNMGDLEVDLSDFPLTNLEAFHKQILSCMKYQTITDGLSILDRLSKGDLFDVEVENLEMESNQCSRQERTLKNGRVIEALPSTKLHEYSDSFIELPMVSNLKEISEMALDNLSLNLYIVEKFRHHIDPHEWEDTFFINEIEYVLAGRFSDQSNYTTIRASLLTLRTALNLAHIYKDSTKREALALAAAVITPGPASAATQIALASTWAGAEAIVDINRLEKGGEVPLYKSSEDWVLSLDQVLAEQTEDSMGNTKEPKGLSYEEYLFLLLCFENKNTKLVRILDLIQLNIQGSESEFFTMEHCYYGFEYHCILVRRNTYLGYFVHRKGVFTGAHIY